MRNFGEKVHMARASKAFLWWLSRIPLSQVWKMQGNLRRLRQKVECSWETFPSHEPSERHGLVRTRTGYVYR